MRALEYKYRILGNYWNGLETLLLSSSSSIRELVRHILTKHTDIDIHKYYLENLSLKSSIKKCILGLGETGKEDDIELLSGYLENSDQFVVRSALHAIGLIKKDSADEIFWKYLQDERLPVRAQAYREICTYKIRYGAKRLYELFNKTEIRACREKIACLLNRERAWDRLPYVLMLYSYEDERIGTIIRRGVNGRSLYGSIPAEKAEWIKSIMEDEKYQIPEEIRKSINFDSKYVTK